MTITVTADRAALVALYNATGGADWTNNTNWLSNEALSEWHRVETDEDGRVTALRLVANELSGKIPAELGNLTNLEDLFLNRNELSGPLPLTLSALSQLLVLDIRETTLCAAGEYCISGVAGNDRFPGNRLRPSATARPRRTENVRAGRAQESAGGCHRWGSDADVGGAGRRRRHGDHGLRVPDRPAGRLDFHRFHRHHPYGYRPRQRHDLRLPGAGGEPGRQEWSFPAGRGDANSAGGFRLGAFCQRGRHHLRSSARECGPPIRSGPLFTFTIKKASRSQRNRWWMSWAIWGSKRTEP